MSLFADRYVNARRADVFLLVVDTLATAAALVYVTGALSRRTALIDTVLLTAWSAVPHIVARLVRSRAWPSEFHKSLRDSLALVVFAGVLAWAGWDLIGLDRVDGPTPKTAGLAVAFWISGFLLFVPPTYRLFDSLGGGVILLGMLEGKPFALPLVLVWITATLVSSPARHQLFDVFAFSRRPRINLQNARVVGLLGASCAIVAFVGLQSSFDWLSRKASGPTEIASTRARRPASRPRPDDPDRRRLTARTIGFTDEVGLSDLGPAQNDPTPVMRVTIPGRDGRNLGPEDGIPSRAILWRAMSFTSIDTWARTWLQYDSDFEEFAPRNSMVRRRLPRGDLPPSRTLEIEVLAPVFKNLVAPYWTSALGGVSRAFGPPGRASYFINALGDIVPDPELEAGTRYRVECRMRVGGRDDLLDAQDHARGESFHYLDVPDEDDTGIDLGALAETVFEGARTPREKVDALRSFFERHRFEYDRELVWTAGPKRLRSFLLDTRKGDCVYYATATALLLRAANIPSRLAIGYSGWEWDPETRTFLIRNGTAHAWTEIKVEGLGWYPIDPVQWVPEGEFAPVSAWMADAGDDDASRSRLMVSLLTLAAMFLLLDLARKRRLGLAPGRGLDAPEEDPEPERDTLPELTLPAPRSPRDVVLRAYARMQQQLRRRRRHRKPQMTPREHAESLRGQGDDVDDALARVERAVYDAVYGAHETEAVDADVATSACKFVAKKTR